MTTLRAQAAAAAPTHEEIEALRPERLSTVGEARGWNVGYAAGWTDSHTAGEAEGARSALGWAFDNSFLDLHDWEKEGEEITFDELLARFLARKEPTDG